MMIHSNIMINSTSRVLGICLKLPLKCVFYASVDLQDMNINGANITWSKFTSLNNLSHKLECIPFFFSFLIIGCL